MASYSSSPVEDIRMELTSRKQKVASLLLNCEDDGAVRDQAVQDVVNYEIVNLAEKYTAFDIKSVFSHKGLVS